MTTRLTHGQAVALGKHLGATFGSATVLTPDDPSVIFGYAMLDGFGALIPGAADVVDSIRTRTEHVSITIPTPIGTEIILAPAAVATPEGYAETISHECEHADQVTELGGLASVRDYLGSGELRATREGRAYATGVWTRYLLTGVLPTIDDAMSPMATGLYHLAHGDLELARGIVTSALASIAAGAMPPSRVALAVLSWLRQHAPDAIVPPAWQVRP